LNAEDRFNIIAFSTGMDVYASKLRPATEANEALPWVNSLGSQGSTDINRALLEAAAMADRERPTYLIFLTDGLPTEGEVDSQKILDNLSSAAPRSLRLFAFGVGYDVDTFLLGSLAQAHHGAATYVLPGEALDEVLSAFYTRISTPVLTGLELEFEEISAYDIFPEPLPDLFIGSQIIAVGRYRQGGTGVVTLSGEVNNQRQTFRYPGQVFAFDSRGESKTLAALPRLWATRKVGYLLNLIRLKGPDQETIDQIVRLSIRYGIVAPYTSYLVTEEVTLGAEAQDRIAQEQYKGLQESPAPAVSGQDAVEKAVEQDELAQAESVAAPPLEAANVVRIVGSRTFVLSDGIWVDTAFDPALMQPQKVAFLSDEYFELALSRPELAAAFALGDEVIALSDGAAFQVVASDVDTGPLYIPPTSTPQPTQFKPRPEEAISTPISIAQAEKTLEAESTQAPSIPMAPTSLPPAKPKPAPGPCFAPLLPLAIVAAGWLWRRGRTPIL
jgi:Ca-activated chloride channel family protein